MNTLVVITGPTASGKTELSIQLAEILGCEIISADSRQFYKGMTIGTAAPDDSDRAKVIHHFVGFLPVDSYYSASLFERDVIALLPSLFARNSIVIMTGGSGMYIDAVSNGIDDIPDVAPEIRERYERKFREEGLISLRRELRIVDPVHYERVDLRNPRRIMRALEIFATTGLPYSSFLSGRKQVRDFRIVKAGIMPDRSELHTRINKRVDLMMAAGLEEEVKSLMQYKGLNALQTVGYRELFDFFDGITTRAEAVELIKRNTRRYARRQITWFNNDLSVKWFRPGMTNEVLEYIRTETQND
ncbi:MAG: tRNA (adenosine(37)-N6)-dimethylallyltransferase MiaA [Bacteroidales bacterium]|nr:tRNA (adenosine(37)-N6)-dimethylallyltransferase MiaA [Bacteroidales bacterium]